MLSYSQKSNQQAGEMLMTLTSYVCMYCSVQYIQSNGPKPTPNILTTTEPIPNSGK